MLFMADLQEKVWKGLVIRPAEYKALLKGFWLEGMLGMLGCWPVLLDHLLIDPQSLAEGLFMTRQSRHQCYCNSGVFLGSLSWIINRKE